MFFTNWIIWIYSFFNIQRNSQDDTIPTKTKHGLKSLDCQGVSAKPNSFDEVKKQDTDTQIIPSQDIYSQGISAKPESIEEMDKDKDIKQNLENIKFKNVLEKIRKYHILDDGDFNYIKLLPNDQMMKFIRNLQ